MKKFKIIISIICFSLFINACHQHEEGDNHDHDHAGEAASENEEDHHDHGNTENVDQIELTQAQMDIIKIEFGKIEKKQLTATLKANGLLKVPNQNKASITALMGGVIQNIYVQAGDYVKKGQKIATLTNTSFIVMQENYLNTTAELSLAKLELNRQIELQSGNAGALKNLQAAEANLATLQTKKASLQKQLNLIGINTNNLSNENIQSVIVISSPINGAISDILVNIGAYVNEQNSIAKVVDNQELHLDLFVFEKDLNLLKVGQTIHFTLTNNAVKEYDAVVRAISNTFENNVKAILVHATIKGDKTGLIDGMSITGLISLKAAELDAIPTAAIVSNEGQDYIIITTQHEENEDKNHEHDGQLFQRIPVIKGTSELGYTEISLLQDIPKNSEVVIKGAYFILAKMTNQGEAHAH